MLKNLKLSCWFAQKCMIQCSFSSKVIGKLLNMMAVLEQKYAYGHCLFSFTLNILM